jgi:transposase
VSINQEQEAWRKACWIAGTNILDPVVLSDQQLIATYKDQGGVERGFRFLKDPSLINLDEFDRRGLSTIKGLLRHCTCMVSRFQAVKVS